MASSSSSQYLSSMESRSVSIRKHEIENVELSDSLSEESLTAILSQQVCQVIECSGRLEHVVDLPSACTEEKLQISECCIYSVPYDMRPSNEQHFRPQIVSIGPLHYRSEKLSRNQHLKEKYHHEFLQHTGVSSNECSQLIEKHERRLRNCYADVIELNTEDFVKMVLVDATFLLTILLYNHKRSLTSDMDRIFRKPKLMRYIRYDMLLLENQLPFFILEELYNIVDETWIPLFGKQTVTSLGHKFFKNWVFTSPQQPKLFGKQTVTSEVAHILDLLRNCLIPAYWRPQRKKIETRNIPRTKELHQAGVKIEVGSQVNMFDIKFHDGILEVPPLFITGSAKELLLRNLLAFELCDCTKEPCFPEYLEMMRYLTLSSEDSELLIQRGVIDSGPTAEEVTKLFNDISFGNLLKLGTSPYSDVINELNAYYKLDRHKWMATLKQKYFKAPWAFCSLSAAVILLVLTSPNSFHYSPSCSS